MDSTPSKKRNALWLLPAFLFAFSALPAYAGEQQDFQAVYDDWKPDKDVTACAFTQRQLENARKVASENPEFTYLTEFTDEVDREIARWKAGRCAGVSPVVKRKVSALKGARIVKVSGKGGAAREWVRVKNTTKKTLAFAGATLRSSKRSRARFPRAFKLKRGKTALVRVGCAAGRKRASAKGLKVWLCRRKPLFADRGDAARLADAKGTFVSQRGYGTKARLIAY
jgi:hypothetical protein